MPLKKVVLTPSKICANFFSGLARFKSIGNAGMVKLARKGGKARARALPRERLREIGLQAVRMREIAKHLEMEKKIEEIPGKYGITARDSAP